MTHSVFTSNKWINISIKKEENTRQNIIPEHSYIHVIPLLSNFAIYAFIFATVRENMFETLFCVIFGYFTLNSVGILLLAYFRYIIVFAVGGTWRNVAA